MPHCVSRGFREDAALLGWELDATAATLALTRIGWMQLEWAARWRRWLPGGWKPLCFQRGARGQRHRGAQGGVEVLAAVFITAAVRVECGVLHGRGQERRSSETVPLTLKTLLLEKATVSRQMRGNENRKASENESKKSGWRVSQICEIAMQPGV